MAQRRHVPRLVDAAGVDDDQRRRRGVAAGVHQPPGDQAGGGQAHVDDDGLVGPGQVVPVEVRLAVGGVACDEGHRLGQASVRQGRAGAGRGGQGGGDAGDDLAGDSRRAAFFQLLAAAAEDERVAALEPDNIESLKRERHQQAVDVVLRQGVAVLALGHVDQPRVRRGHGEDFRGDQAVMHDHPGRRDQPRGLEGQQLRIARTGAHQPHLARRGGAGGAIESDQSPRLGRTGDPGHDAIVSL